ncbi:MAG: class I SAM-dependent methyltransferase [Candidatus Peregrinibacteria bacterium]
MPDASFDIRQRQYWQHDKHRRRRDPADPVIRAYTGRKIAYMKNAMHMPEHPSILDVGAGNGYFSYWLQTLGDVTAVDYSDVILANNPVEKKMVMDARSLTFPDGSFDLSFCHAVLHHIRREDRPAVLKEMTRVSRQYVVIIEPNRWNPVIAAFSTLKREERGGLDFSLSACRRLVLQAGLRVLAATTWGFLTPNRMPLSSVLLPLFLSLERPLPFGVSTIVIAEKTESGT